MFAAKFEQAPTAAPTPPALGCDSSDCSLCHGRQAGKAAPRQPSCCSAALQQAASSAHSSLQSSSTWQSSSCFFMAQPAAEVDSQCSREAAFCKRQRVNCDSGDASVGATCSPPEEDATVPSQGRMVGNAGSCSALADLDTTVPEGTGGSGGARKRKAGTSPSQEPKHSDVVMPAPPQLQRQHSCTSDAAWLARYGGSVDGSVVNGASQHLQPAQLLPQTPALTQVAAFKRPHLPLHPQANADIVSGVDFSSDGWFVATAGIRKQIRLYSLAAGFAADAGSRPPPVALHRMPAKLSSLAWCPDADGIVTVGDYDGDVSQIDLNTGHHFADADGHSGRRIWSVAHSHLRPNLCASASDDGTAAVWGGRGLAERALPALRPHKGWSVNCVDFCREDEHALMLACADGCAYVYDLRNSLAPLQRLKWHTGSASFARFCGRGAAATAAIDGTVAVWDIAAAGTGTLSAPRAAVRGHANSRNFVGLSVLQRDRDCGSSGSSGHVVACGSEDGVVYTYLSSQSSPLATWPLRSGPGATPAAAPFSGGRDGDAAVVPTAADAKLAAGGGHVPASSRRPAIGGHCEFVSGVAWAPPGAAASAAPLLAVSASDGDLRVLSLASDD